jgi:hypothetical protein
VRICKANLFKYGNTSFGAVLSLCTCEGTKSFKLVICTYSKGLEKENLLLVTCHCHNRNVYMGEGSKV